ncbi:MAG: hypothetical protein ACRDSS_04300, partial [Actinocrinis sp.]
MTYGPDGEGFTDYPDYGPPNPQTRRPRPVVRPEPYDPFGTRERDQSAADQQRYGSQPRARQQARPGGGQHDGGRQGAGRHGPDQYGGDQHARDPYRQTAQVPRYAQRPGATRVGGGGDEYPFDLRSPESVMRGGRTAEADGRTDDPSPERPPAAGGRANRRKGKKVVPPHVRRRRKIARRGILAVFLLIIGYVGVTMYPYLTAPGTDRLNARVAEWGRDHHLGWAVTWLENATYTAPPTGGKLDAGELAQLQGATASEPPKAKVDLPANITPLAAGTVPGEGVWHPVTMNSTGVPIVEKAALRPDAKHTSNLAYVMWMNQKALSFGLHPGYQQPGGNWSTPDMIGPAQRPGLVATWNGGFKVKPNDALGGFYADGRTAASLVNGKAAEVFYKDGSLRVGMWGRDETMAPDVSGVRQNLSLLVDT